MIDFSNGLNATELQILESDRIAHRLLTEIKRYIDMGYNPNDIIDKVYRDYSVSMYDLLPKDFSYVVSEIEDYYRLRNR